MPYSVHILHRGGLREQVYEGTPHACAVAFFEHIARGSLGALAEGRRRIRAPYTVAIRDERGREVAHGRDLDAFRQSWRFDGFSQAARLTGLLRALPISVSALLGESQGKALARSAAEGRGISAAMVAHIQDRISAAQGMLAFAESVAANAEAPAADPPGDQPGE